MYQVELYLLVGQEIIVLVGNCELQDSVRDGITHFSLIVQPVDGDNLCRFVRIARTDRPVIVPAAEKKAQSQEQCPYYYTKYSDVPDPWAARQR